MKFAQIQIIGKWVAIPCNGSVALIDRRTGELKKGRIILPGRQIFRIAALGSNSILIHAESELIAYDFNSMRPLWKVEFKSGITSFHTSDKYVWVGTWEGGVAVLDSRNGSILNRYLHKSKGVHVVDFGRRTLCVGLDGTVSAMFDTREIYRNRSREPYLAMFAEMSHLDQLICGTSDGSIEALDINSGLRKWKVEAGAQVISLSSSKDAISVILADGRVANLSAADGAVLWSLRFNGQPPELVVSVQGAVVTAGDNKISLHRLGDGAILKEFQTAGRIAAMTNEDKMIIIRLENGLINAFNINN
ncbi:MAG: PQQ-binding-like beta-propeller repeat protein [Fibrobacteres bacterium]|nr:PQQ-binding-like beta-propeller repeat protein [Fibrobacterota bacterium]